MLRRKSRFVDVGALALAASLAAACGGGKEHLPSGPTTGGSPRPGWQPAERIADAGEVLRDAYDGVYPPDVRIALDGSGSGVAIWEQTQPPDIRASHFTPEDGWGEPLSIADPPSFGQVADPDVGLAHDGSGLAVWAECCPDSSWNTWGSAYSPAGWGSPGKIQVVPSGTYATRGRGIVRPVRPRVLQADDGSALVLWSSLVESSSYPHGARSNLWARRSVRDEGWQSPTLLAPEELYLGNAESVGTAAGEALVAWTGLEGLFIQDFDPAKGWSPPEQLAGPRHAHSPAVALDASGRAVAAWIPFYYSVNTRVVPPVLASYRDSDRIWSVPETIIDTDDRPAVAIDAKGGVLVAWSAPDGLWARSRPADGPWAERERVGFKGGSRPGLAVDPAGAAVVAWRIGPRVWAARRHPGKGWQPPEILAVSGADLPPTAADMDYGSEPRVAVDAGGNAMVVWSQVENRQVTIWASRFVAP